MKTTATKARPSLNRYVIAGVALMTAVTLSRPDLLTKVYAANQYQWTKQEDIDLLGGSYTSAASSANGDHLILGTAHGGESSEQESPLLISQDYGTTWENVAEEVDPGFQHFWTDVDISNDGQTMVAASDARWDIEETDFLGGGIFKSVDGGDTWTELVTGSDGNWREVALSGDGTKVVAVNSSNDGDLRVSENGGAFTTIQASVGDVDYYDIQSISLSDNGDKILIGGENNDNYSTDLVLSTNNGDTWTSMQPFGDVWLNEWYHDISDDGSTIVVATKQWNGGDIDTVHISTNGGSTWTETDPDSDNFNSWRSVSVSDDGSTALLLDDNGSAYISTDSGDTWNAEDPGEEYEDNNAWTAGDINEDGTQMVVAGQYNAYLLGNQIEPQPEEGGSTVTLSDPEGGKTITLTTPEGTTITCHSAVKESGLTAKDAAYAYPLGLVDFCFSGAEASNQISIVFVTDLKPNQVVVRKYKPGTNQYSTVTEATVTETTHESQHALLVTYNLVDNGPLDTDPDVGEVADPIGLGVSDLAVPNTGFSKAK